MSEIDRQVARLNSRGYDWPIPWDAVESIARSEDCRLQAYRCVAGVPTIGWGETDGVSMGDVWTAEQADEMFRHEVEAFTFRVQALLKEPATQYQLGAMVSLAYNIGLGAFSTSTVLRKHNDGDPASAARAFELWNKFKNPVSGRLEVSRGLTGRRAVERALYLRDDDAGMPQAVVGGRWA